MMTSSRSLVTTNGFVAIGLVVGFANHVAIAAIFGLTRRVDAFYAAQMLPNLFMFLCLSYLGKNFLPTYARARRESPQVASELTSSIVTIMALFAIGIAILLSIVSRPLFELLLPGFNAEDLEWVRRYFWIMAPTLVLMAVTVFHEYTCQHDENYVRITAIRSALPVANLASILLASPLIGEYALPVGYLLGHFVVFFLMASQARYTYTWRVSVRRDWEQKIFSNSAILMGSGLLARTRVVILNYLGSTLGAGALSAIALASRLTDPLGHTVFTAVRMMMFSRAARLAVDGNGKAIARLYEIGLSAAFLLLAPLLFWMGLNSDVIVDVLFVRGEFDQRMAAMVTLALIGAVPSVVFAGVNTLLSNAFYATDRVIVPALVMPIGTLIYLAVAPWLSSRYGVIGLTLGTSAATGVIFVIMFVLLARQVVEFNALRTSWRLMRYIALSAISFFAAEAALESIDVSDVVAAASSLVAGAAIYLAALIALKDSILAFVYRYLSKAIPTPRRPVGGAPGGGEE